MGRKAKLKKIRREASSQPPSSQAETDFEPTQFVQELEKQGYQLRRSDRCPELPQQNSLDSQL